MDKQRASLFPSKEDDTPVSDDIDFSTSNVAHEYIHSGSVSDSDFLRYKTTKKQPKLLSSFLVLFNHFFHWFEGAKATKESEHLKGYLPRPETALASHQVRAQDIDIHRKAASKAELEYLYRTALRIYHIINKSRSGQFTLSFLDFLCDQLDLIADRLTPLAGGNTQELSKAINDLISARNELVLAIDFLDFEEINPIYRLILRNKAVFRLRNVLHNVLLIWPAQLSNFNQYHLDIRGNLPGDASTDAPPPKKKKKPKSK